MPPKPQRSSTGADRSLIARTAAVAAAAALALAGCGALMPGQGGAADTTSAGPGVSGDSVKVVFVGVDLDSVKDTTGFNTAAVGNPEEQVQALEDWVNDNGGIGGRQLDAVFKWYDASTDSPAAEEQLCDEVVQDEQAFAVVLTGQFQSNARPCYAGRQTLMLDATLVASDTELYDELAPYLWSPSFPSYDGFVTSYIETLSSQGFFEGSDQVALVAADTPVNRRTIEGDAVPLLEEYGVTPEIAWVDMTNIGTIYAGSEQGIVTFTSKGIDRALFLGGSRIPSIFATVAAGKGYKPTYAISSFDNPTFFMNNPGIVGEGTMDGMVGLGFHPPQDVFDDQLPFPREGVEQECIDIYAEAGITFETRENARVALPYCDAVRLLALGGEGVEGELNASNWAAAVQERGSEFEPAAGFGTGLADGGFAAAGAYRVLKYAADCSCFRYEGDDVPFAED